MPHIVMQGTADCPCSLAKKLNSAPGSNPATLPKSQPPPLMESKPELNPLWANTKSESPSYNIP